MNSGLSVVPDLLDFALHLSGGLGPEVLSLDVRMLKEGKSSATLLAVLDEINIPRDVNLNVSCRAVPIEPGSLLKRVIVDQRAGE